MCIKCVALPTPAPYSDTYIVVYLHPLTTAPEAVVTIFIFILNLVTISYSCGRSPPWWTTKWRIFRESLSQ